MQVVRIIVAFLTCSILVAIARADDVDEGFATEDATAYTIEEAGGGTGIQWKGGYTTAPGSSLYLIKASVFDANLKKFPATVTTGKGTWEAKTDALPDGTYKMTVSFYFRNSLGNIVLSNTIQSNSVTIP